MRRITAALFGNVDAGKSTLINALVEDIVAPDSALKLTSYRCEIRMCKERAGRCFGVIFADQQQRDMDIESLWAIMSEGQQGIDSLILYAEPSALLEHLRLIDLPGLKMDHDEKVLELATETDVLVYVASESGSVRLFEVVDTAATLPCASVIVVNKIDRDIHMRWEDPAFCLDKVAMETEDKVRENVKQQVGNTEIVAVSGLVAIASDIWEDPVFQGVLRLAEPGDFDVISKNIYFGEERAGRLEKQDRQALLAAANASFQGAWITPEYHNPAWPALMFAIGVAIHQGAKSPDALRQSMRKFSGIDRLRSLLLSISQSDRITARQDALGAVGEAETERLRLHRAIGHVRLLLESTDRIATTVVNAGLGHAEERKYFDDLKAHLESREAELSVCLREKQQWLSGMRQAYRQTASDEY